MPLEIRHKLPPLEALTAVRFFAAMYVVLYHSDVRTHISHPSDWPLFLNFAYSGYTAVTLFFVLSGFILAYNYPKISSRKNFWIARFARIYPVFFLSCCFAVARRSEWHIHPFLPRVLTAFLLLQALWPPFFGALNQYGWTLSVEAFFYALFPFLLPLLSRTKLKVFLLIEAAYLLLVTIPIVLALGHHHVQATWAVTMLESRFAPMRINTFIVGVYLGIHWRRSVEHSISSALPTDSARWQLLTGALGSVLLLIVPVPYFALPLRTCLITYTYALLILGLAGVDWWILTNRLMRTAGEMSYSIYILQFPVLFTYAAICWRVFPGYIPSLLVYVPLLLVVAYVVLRTFEMPARLALRRALTAKPVPTTSA